MNFKKYNKILDIFLNNLIPETKISVSKGNKIFGAFVLNKIDLSLVVTGVNNEIENPIYHGEISTIINFFKLRNLNPKDYLFVSSHEPCSLCLSAITWSGFDNFYYLFHYEETESNFNIPYDLKILKEVFKIDKGEYSKNNTFWQSYSIVEEIKKLQNAENDKLLEKIKEINKLYEDISNNYQSAKNSNHIPLK
ncbi:MAG: nucleoside deaminase [Alphaproteobacteria bacterium]